MLGEFTALYEGSIPVTMIVFVLIILILTIAIRLCRSNQNGTITKERALKIYERKLHFMRSITCMSRQTKALNIRKEQAKLATRYGVQLKEIEDIWNRRTWVLATAQLWTDETGY
jgi:hypothetical protein